MSVIAEPKPWSRISTTARLTFSSSIGSAICTAGRLISSDFSVSSAEAKGYAVNAVSAGFAA